MSRSDVSVVISTRNRSESLKTTLECLAASDRTGIRAEVIVVDNGSEDDTEGVAGLFSPRIPIRYVREPRIGKCHAMNRGAAEARGEILVMLDDDMSVDAGWFQAVVGVCRRFPGADIFGGTIRIAWPTADVPPWASRPELKGEIYSAEEYTTETPLAAGKWFSGNHFWFRSSVLARGIRFDDDNWVTEGKFQLDLAELGCRTMACPSAIADHRIQPDLMRPDVVINRAERAGRAFAKLRLQPYRAHVQRARAMHEHPWISRAYCVGRHLYYRLRYCVSCLYPADTARFADKVVAVMWMNATVEYLRVANRLDAYSLWRRTRNRELAT